ncbi:DUF6336 family protein [Nocardia sp. NPDC003963]
MSIGLFFRACSIGEILRRRDFGTTRAPHEVVSIAAPFLARAGAFLLAPVPVASGLGELVASHEASGLTGSVGQGEGRLVTVIPAP